MYKIVLSPLPKPEYGGIILSVIAFVWTVIWAIVAIL